MTAQLVYLWDRLRSSFWPIPSVMTLGAMLAALFMLWIDGLPWSVWIFWWMASSTDGAEGARLVLSTIAGSMMTVASLVFSMTLVALTLAASNIGPRLLDRFMDNRVNQIALGLFLSTFVYSLLILRAVTDADPPFIPHLSISLAIVMAIFSFGWLIYFIHNLARAIQVDNVVARVSGELNAGFQKLATRYPEASNAPTAEQVGTPVSAACSGYIQALDANALLDLANKNDLVLRMSRRAGHFVIPSTANAEVVGPTTEDTEDEIRAAIVVGPKRTASEDVEFGIDQLVEIAARALSPGVNDYFTALACVDNLAAALATVFDNGLPGNGFSDESGRLRLVLDPVTYDGLIDTAFNPLRRAASNNLPVIVRLLEVLTTLAKASSNQTINTAIARHGNLICQRAAAQEFAMYDQQIIDDRYGALCNYLDVRAN